MIILLNKNKMKYSSDQLEEYQYQQNYVDLPSIKHKNKSIKRKARPITVNIIDTQYEVIEQVCWDLDHNIVFEKDLRNWDLKWVDGPVSVELLSKLQSHQKINHFPGMNTLSRKNNLAKNMVKMQMNFPEFYNFIPKTFILPGDGQFLRTYFGDNRRKGKQKTFIVKPQASCQGRGIFLSQSLAGTSIEIQGYGQCVVQSYIENPLLYKGLKFDMRIYALVAGCDPLRLYIYNEGLVRFATQKYEPVDEENIDNLYMHLTNYAINKDSPKYVFNESLDNLSLGHKKSLAEFFQTLKGLGLPAHDYWSSIKEIIVKTIISGQPHLSRQYRMAQPNNLPNNMCFEVLGFDFMIDDRNKVYLLEVNYTPSFSTETPLDHLIKSNLIRDTLVLMNVTPQARDKALKSAKEVLDRRVFTGKMTKYSPEQREKLVKQYQKERDQYQKKHLGSFEKIYPCRNSQRQARYDQFLEYSQQQYKETSSPQKIGQPRRSSSKYRIKKIISNSTIYEDEQQLERTPNNVKTKQTNRQPFNNPELSDKSPALAQLLREKMSHSIPPGSKNIFQYSSQNQAKLQAKVPEVRVMNVGALETRNGQSTMFSKQYNAQTAG